EYMHYPRHAGRFTGEPAYFKTTFGAARMLLEKTGMEQKDFAYAVFHQPNPKFPVEVAMRLGFTLDQVKTGLLNPMIGNTYAGSSPIGLAAVLDEAKSGDKILMCSFGSGAGSDAFCIEVLEGITASRGVNPTVKSMMERSTKIDYSTYSKFRDKLHK
ncbi:MAG: hydroxymethylglutaryl-CoA synthase, partial [Nitrososphaerota archaeon]|nr:hydroxymethylglutaryl-CoA synthase [Nitrososphaerota archaeon]